MGRSTSIDPAVTAAVLDRCADDLRPRCAGRTAVTSARLLAGYLTGEIGYGGSRSNYYDVSNILFDKVVAQRRGVPVSLALLYILIGRRAGLDITGVALPDHFLVRVHGARPVLLDPFHGGRTITKVDCLRYLRSAGYASDANSLSEVDDRAILLAFLGDLQRVYGYREDREICEALQRARRLFASA
jgi:regulator of sirC expression with transglutaminase-like and TPR domain